MQWGKLGRELIINPGRVPNVVRIDAQELSDITAIIAMRMTLLALLALMSDIAVQVYQDPRNCRRIVARSLNRHGHRVRTSGSGREVA